MSKKEEAFELFSQGKGVDDPEVVALELKKDSLERYYSEWEKMAEPEPVITTFLLNGKLLRVENGVVVGEVEEEEVPLV